MNIIGYLNNLYASWKLSQNIKFREKQIASYFSSGRRPWSVGYSYYKDDFIQQSINNLELMECFRSSLPLPGNYGEFLDERVVEYPWCLSRLNTGSGSLLDAGSALNFPYIVKHPYILNKDLTIVTLEPEENNFCKDRISYQFGDIRDLPLRDNWFDEVVSISTLEHVGMNNAIYTENTELWQGNTSDYLKAVLELKRVTKPGGKVYITVPYGKYTDFGWYQQFNAEMIEAIIECFAPAKSIETYFCYESGGWSIGNKLYCQKFEGFNIHDTKYFNPNSTKDYDPDYAACSRAIAALELWK